IVWDGKDAAGRYVSGEQTVVVELTYVYPLAYRPTNRFGYNGNATLTLSSNRVLGAFSITKRWKGAIGTFSPPVSDLGGWTLSVQNTYDPQHLVLYLGTGEKWGSASQNGNVIKLMAGNGHACTFSNCGQEGITATNAYLTSPYGVAVAPDGQLYFSDKTD